MMKFKLVKSSYQFCFHPNLVVSLWCHRCSLSDAFIENLVQFVLKNPPNYASWSKNSLRFSSSQQIPSENSIETFDPQKLHHKLKFAYALRKAQSFCWEKIIQTFKFFYYENLFTFPVRKFSFFIKYAKAKGTRRKDLHSIFFFYLLPLRDFENSQNGRDYT